MKKYFKNIIAVVAVIAIAFSLVSVSAEEYSARPVSWWDSFILKGIGNPLGIPIWDSAMVAIADHSSGVVCSGPSPDRMHHGYIVKGEQRGAVDKNGNPFFDCICQYCGDHFKGYGSDLKAAYDDYVSSLPAQGYNSSGNLIWYSTVNDIVGMYGRSSSGGYTSASPSSYTKASDGINFRFAVEGILIIQNSLRVEFPYSGSYRLLPELAMSYDGGTVYYNRGSWASRSQGDRVYADIPEFSVSADGAWIYFLAHYPVYEFIPVNSSSSSYDITTRPTSVGGGNYGIVGDNGQITKVENNSTIVNEVNNTYYNPVTGKTGNITSWSYDYGDRSYNLTLESGDTVTVTYGDEYITIREGDTVYNIYYIIEGSGSDTHTHDWRESSVTDPTCTQAGAKVYTCSTCGDTKQETTSALGHNWLVKETQQGYTIYECSRCHEQYKSENGSAPPGGGSSTDPGGEDSNSIWRKLGELLGSILGGILSLLDAILGKILDALISLAEMLLEKLAVVVETILRIFEEVPKLFGGFLEFLVAVFPFLPPELMTILTFGVAAIVFIGIIKAVRR